VAELAGRVMNAANIPDRGMYRMVEKRGPDVILVTSDGAECRYALS
jgi:hypothetical protein